MATYKFPTKRSLERHFAVHGKDFGSANAEEYQSLADALWNQPKKATLRECVRQNGEKIRFDEDSDAFSVVDGSAILTFYKAIPCNSVPLTDRDLVKRTGRCHGESNNLLYFSKECQK